MVVTVPRGTALWILLQEGNHNTDFADPGAEETDPVLRRGRERGMCGLAFIPSRARPEVEMETMRSAGKNQLICLYHSLSCEIPTNFWTYSDNTVISSVKYQETAILHKNSGKKKKTPHFLLTVVGTLWSKISTCSTNLPGVQLTGCEQYQEVLGSGFDLMHDISF